MADLGQTLCTRSPDLPRNPPDPSFIGLLDDELPYIRDITAFKQYHNVKGSQVRSHTRGLPISGSLSQQCNKQARYNMMDQHGNEKEQLTLQCCSNISMESWQLGMGARGYKDKRHR